MTKEKDDLEAVRTVVEALEGFSPEDQERVIRWAREKIGLAPAPRSWEDRRSAQAPPIGSPSQSAQSQQPSQVRKDLRTFVAEKQPKSDVQFAATVAYFYRFEAPVEQRRNEVDADTLLEACRLADRKRLKKPGQTLRNAKTLGLMDSGSEAGKFIINTVGENLVAMTLPRKAEPPRKPRKAKKGRKKPAGKK